MPALLFFLEKGVNPLIKIKKRAIALLLGTVTFFIALAMPYNTTRVYAADVAFSWVVNESSNTILNWILLYLGISVAPEAISEGKVFDKTGQFALDFCNEFFGDTFEQWYASNGFSEDINTFKREFNDILTQDFDAVKYVAGDVKSSVLDTVYSYLCDSTDILSSDMSFVSSVDKAVDNFKYGVKGEYLYDGSYRYKFDYFRDMNVIAGDSAVFGFGVFVDYGNRYHIYHALLSASVFNTAWPDEPTHLYASELSSYGFYLSGGWDAASIAYNKILSLDWNIPHINIKSDIFDSVYNNYVYRVYRDYLQGVLHPNIDIPDVAGKDWAYDLVGWPNAWDIDKPDVKPWDNVDSLPIPGDIAIPKEIPGVTDLPGILDGVIGGTIPWPDIIDIIKDLPVDPEPEPKPEPKPEPELPEIPAVLPQGVSDKLKDLSGKFPFCIPFDLVDCFKSFGSNDAAEAPKWDLTFRVPGTNKDYEFSVDLSMFDKYIPIFRSGVLILFLIGLILGTRKLIGWQVKN